MNRTLFFFAAIVLLVTFVKAQDATTPDVTAQPKSLAAKQAETKFNADMQKLDTEYQTKAVAIKQAYLDGLKNALRTLASKTNSDPDEIANLSAKIKEIQGMVLQSPLAASQVKRISCTWKVTWPGGSTQCTFKKNGIVVYADLPGECEWLQDGSKIVDCTPHGYHRMVLSNDGKSMTGTTNNGIHHTYTFISN